jgi:GT2 family glycosyltransferase
MKQPFISVVVLAYNQFEKTTLPCLKSLSPWFEDHSFEFIVFDNASPDGSGPLAQSWCATFPNLKFVQSKKNLGYSGGMNAAAELAQGQWLFLVNNDTEFPRESLSTLRSVLQKAPPQMAMIGPVTNSAGNGQRLFDPHKNKSDWMELGAWLNTHPTGILLTTYRCDFFCIAIRRDVWHILHGLDPIFGMGYFEDFDFSLRLRAKGFDQSITEDVFVFHQGSATFQSSKKTKALIKSNKKLMQKKHPQVHFIHARDCNLRVLKEYRDLASESKENLSTRKKIRVSSLKYDQPKSPLKKLIWKIKTASIKK